MCPAGNVALEQWFPNFFKSRLTFQNMNIRDPHNVRVIFQADSVTFVDTRLPQHSSERQII